MSNTTVISVSLTQKNLQDLDRYQEMLGLAGRSEAIRVCLRSAEAEMKELEHIEGDVEGILIVVHKADEDLDLDKVSHKHQHMISTQVHSHLKSGKCLDVFLLGGSADTIQELLSDFQKNDSLEYIKFMRS